MSTELFRTLVAVPEPPFRIHPAEPILCVGSCFADEIGRRLHDDHFPAIVNPFGVMYNPASILHTIERLKSTEGPKPALALLTLGTNHVYIERATGEIVDNCQKRPQQLFEERCLSVDECADYLQRAIDLLCEWNPAMNVILTVSPIRYRKYSYHGSQLSKATLLMAADQVIRNQSDEVTNKRENLALSPRHSAALSYFPAYEILLDELRDYRFYATDMLHPSPQAIDYIYSRFSEAFFSAEAQQFVGEWRPIREALAHRPFHPESPEYQTFREKVDQQRLAFETKWKISPFPVNR